MEITYLGHSSFLFNDSKGNTILTDPFDENLQIEYMKKKVNIVTISHRHFHYNPINSSEDCPMIIETSGHFQKSGINIIGIDSFHDSLYGLKRGRNIIYIFEIDDYRLCHLGDLGHILDQTTIESMGNIHILFVPIGGNFTINGKTASQICKRIQSNIIIPMHYKTAYNKFPLEGLESFISNMKNVEKVNSNKLIVSSPLTHTNQVKILNPTM